MSNSYTYRDPTLSLWQSAVAEVHRRRNSIQSRMADSTIKRLAASALAAADELMSPAYLIGNSATPDLLFNTETAPLSAEARAAVPIDCAKVLRSSFLDICRVILGNDIPYFACAATMICTQAAAVIIGWLTILANRRATSACKMPTGSTWGWTLGIATTPLSQ